MDKFNFFFRQRVASSEMQDAFNAAEAADHKLLTDLFGGGFLLASVAVTETVGPSTSVVVGTIAAYNTLGERVTEAGQNFSFAGDSHATLVTPARLYVKFKRDESNPRVDGLGNTVQYDQDEGAELQRDLGTPGGALPALRTDGSIQLATINIPAASANILNANITTSVQNLRSTFPTARLADFQSSVVRGYISTVKIVTTGAATPTDMIDVESATAVNGGATPDKLMRVRNAPLDLAVTGAGGRDAGPLINATWYIYLIGDSNGVNADKVIASLSAGPGYGGAPPTLPGTHNRFRLIGVLIRSAGTIIPFRQINGETYFDDVSLTVAFAFAPDPHVGAQPTPYVALALAPYCPAIAERVTLAMYANSTAAVRTLYEFRSPGGPTQPGPSNHFRVGSAPDLNENHSESHMVLHASATQTVEWRRGVTGDAAATADVQIALAGFTSEFHHE